MRAINFCWFGFKWAVALAAVGAGVVAFLLYHRVDEEIRSRVQARLAEHYRGLKVTIRSAQLVEGKGIQIRDLVIAERGGKGLQAELLRVEEAMFECPTDWKELMGGDPRVRRVVIRRPTFRATRGSDGGWSIARLLPLPVHNGPSPQVTVENGAIEIFDAAKSTGGALRLRELNLTLTPVAPSEPGATPGTRRLEGTLAGEGFRRIAFEGWVDARTPACSIRGGVEGLEVSPELRDGLPDSLAKYLPRGEIRGQGDLKFAVSYDPAQGPPFQFDISGRLTRGQIDDARLPHALTDIAATVHADNGGITVDNLSARLGQATLWISCRRSGFGPDAPLGLTAQVRKLELDHALHDVLPTSLQDQWRKYSPAGTIDADLQLGYDGRTWRPDLTVQCQSVSFMHYRYPYRLDRGRGTFTLKNDVLKMDITAYSGSQPVRLRSECVRPLSAPTGWFEARGEAIAIDDGLMAALPEKSRNLARSLDPRGTIGFYLRTWRDRPEEPIHQHLIVGLNDCSIRYEKFPYPLTNVRGALEMRDGDWTFNNVEGMKDSARITCQGRFTRGPDGGLFVLGFSGRDVPLDEELCEALSPQVRQTWRDLRPRGAIDVDGEVTYQSGTKKFSVAVRAQPQPQTASIEPVYFPYRLDRLQGVLLYRDGHVTFERCRAEHAMVKISTEGYCDLLGGGQQHLHFGTLSADGLRCDRELVQALPERLRKALAELNPTGPINLRGSIDVLRGRAGEPAKWEWDMRLLVQHAAMQCGRLPLENICGEVSLAGRFDAAGMQCRGELSLDSASYRDYQFTQVMGPIWMDDGHVLFGAWVDRQNGSAAAGAGGPPRPPRSLTANLFGGKVYGDGWATFAAQPGQPSYMVNLTLTDADLGRCAQEAMPGRHKLRGKVVATADLTGNGWSRHALSGKGQIRLSDADVYELPVMIALLKIVSIRLPDQRAFSDVTIDYRVEGEHIYFDHVVFHGDAISLRGKGEMDFQSAIHLTFYALVGRGELDIPVVKQVFRGASQQLMLIHVDGTLQNPETRREALPVVNQALQQIREELQNRK